MMKAYAQRSIQLTVLALFLYGNSGSAAAPEAKAQIQVPLGKSNAVFRLVSPRKMEIDYPDYYLLETEVTNLQFRDYLLAMHKTKDDSEVLAKVKKRDETGEFPSTGDVPLSVEDPDTIWHDNDFPRGLENHPVAHVTLHDANDFCRWLSERHAEVGTFRLPTWNEWMLAAFGASRKYPWGDQWDKSRVHMSFGYKSNLPKRTEEVKARPKGRSPEGIYGLLGNVDEYIDPRDPTTGDYFNLGSRFMGGGFTDGRLGMGKDKIAPRKDYWGYSHHSTARTSTLGFRVMLDPTKDKSLLKHKRLFDQNDRSWMIK